MTKSVDLLIGECNNAVEGIRSILDQSCKEGHVDLNETNAVFKKTW